MNSKQSRTQLLGHALGAQVIEDFGYRGILYNDEHGYMRYHSANGLQKVMRAGRQWRLKETILTSEDVDTFLKDAGLVVQSNHRSILQQLHEALGGEIKETFSSGGGIVYTDDSVYVRYSPITGLDIVELSLTKWTRKVKVFRSALLTDLVRKDEWEEIGGRYREALRAYGRGSTQGSRAVAGAEGEARRVSEEAQRDPGGRPGGDGEGQGSPEDLQPVGGS